MFVESNNSRERHVIILFNCVTAFVIIPHYISQHRTSTLNVIEGKVLHTTYAIYIDIRRHLLLIVICFHKITILEELNLVIPEIEILDRNGRPETTVRKGFIFCFGYSFRRSLHNILYL